MSVNFEQLRSQHSDWTNLLIFGSDNSIITDTASTAADEIQGYITLFNDYDNAIKLGVTYNGVHYHVHRFYDGIMYGRADPGTKRTDGFCLYRVDRDGKSHVYILITYELPNVSARIIPEMVKAVDSIKDQLP